MTKEELLELFTRLYFFYETESVTFEISDGDIHISIDTFLKI